MDEHGRRMDAFFPANAMTEVPAMRDQGDDNALTIQALGVPIIRLGGKMLVFGRRKSAALLIYLAVTRSAHSRDALANLLWGDLPQMRATANLRKVLAELREHVGDAVVITRHTIAANTDYPIVLDVAAFETAIARGVATANAPMLARAVQGYPEDFLAGFCIPTADAFDEWVMLYREHLREQLIVALESLATLHVERGEFRAALGSARRVVALDPWREEGHRRLMWLMVGTGDRAAAIAQYEACRRTLANELGIEPSADTTALYRQLIADTNVADGRFRTDTLSSRGLDGDRHAQGWTRRKVTGRVRNYARRGMLQRCLRLALQSYPSAGRLACPACVGGGIGISDAQRAK